MALSPRQASLAAWTVRPLEHARGGISAEFIIPYPPAIPMIVPGEIISAELISTIAELKRHGHRIIGPSDASLRTVRLLKTDS
jgi:arginine/lysine/ornithine decarboxylase